MKENGDSKTFMQRWLEPPVQSKPSFQDAGLMRGGVLENMAPLGTLPKAAMLKKASASAESPPPTSAPVVKRIVFKKPYTGTTATNTTTMTAPTSTVSTPNATRSSPEALEISTSTVGAVGDPMDVDASQPLSPLSQHFPIPIMDDGDDEDYVPKKASKARRPAQQPSMQDNSDATRLSPYPTSRRQSGRHKSARSSPTPAATATPTLAIVPTMELSPDVTQTTPTPAPLSPTHSDSPSSPLGREPDDKEQADRIVTDAVNEALRYSRFPTAYALRTLYDENSSDPHFVSMIEDLFYQRASREVCQKLIRMMSDRKKEGKDNNKAFRYFVSSSAEGTISPPSPVRAPYENLLGMDFTRVLRSSVAYLNNEFPDEGHVSKKRKTDRHTGIIDPALLDNETMPGHDETNEWEQNVDKAATHFTEQTTPKQTETNEQDAETVPAPHIDDHHMNGEAADTILTPDVNEDAHVESVHGPDSHHQQIPTPLAIKNKSPRKTPKKTPKKSPQKRKMKRAASVSSISSLSSVPDDAIEDYDEFMDSVDEDLDVSRLEDEEGAPNDGQTPVGSAQPISTEQSKPAAKRAMALRNPASLQTTPVHHHHSHSSSSRSRDPSMQSATITTTSSTTTTSKPQSTKQASTATPNLASRVGETDDTSIRLIVKKRTHKAETTTQTTDASLESFVRDPLTLDEELVQDLAALPQQTLNAPTPSRQAKTPLPALSSRAARAAKRRHDELDEASSPTALSFRADLEPPSTRTSRAATPATNAQSSKKPRGGLRVKTS